MAAAAMTPAKRVLAESTYTRNALSPHSSSIKKRKLDGLYNGGTNENQHVLSSQPKSQFEEHLESLTQDLKGLKKDNQEKDQQWARPALVDFNENTVTLCFQQIDAEEGLAPGGKQAVKLFGVTEVS